MRERNELTSMNVSLPASQKDYVRLKAAASGCSTPSEYVRRLIHADQKAHQAEELESKLLEGLDSHARKMGAREWSRLRRTLRADLERRRKASRPTVDTSQNLGKL